MIKLPRAVCDLSRKPQNITHKIQTAQRKAGSMNDVRQNDQDLDIIAEQVVAIDMSEVWRQKLVTLAHVAGSTVLAFAMVASFVFLEA